MKNLTLVFGLLLANTLFSQNNISHFTTDYKAPNVLRYSKLYENNSRTQNCNTDTIYYTDAKSSNQAIKVAFTTGSVSTGFAIAYSQLFQGANNLTVHGFKWYGKSYDPNLLSNPNISVVCEMYDAGSNGLPTGSPLASETIIVDTNSNNMEHDIIFSSPIVTSNDYVIVVKNNQADQLFVMSNDEMNNDGGGEALSGVFFEPLNAWRKCEDVFGFGDFDLLVLPFVQYSIDAGFTTPAFGCENALSTFTNTSSNHFANSTLNTDLFYGSAVQHDWTYGDGNTDDNVTTGNNTYNSSGTFNIALVSTITGWTMSCTDATANSFTVNPEPATPTSVAPSPVCEYSVIGDLTASGGSGGAIYSWYDNAGLTSLLGTGTPFSSGITLTDTVYVTITENGCEGPDLMLPLAFDSNAIPVFTPVSQGNNTIDFTGAPSASVYAWDFGDGNSSVFQSPTNLFASAGPYTVCLDVTYTNSCTNQYCDNISMVGINENDFDATIQAYPNPTENDLNIVFEQSPKDTYLVVYDSYGKFIYRTQAQKNNVIALSDYSSGIYFLSIEEKGRVISRKKVIRK